MGSSSSCTVRQKSCGAWSSERANEKVWVFFGGENVGTGKDAAQFIGFGPSDLERPMHVHWEVQAQLPTDEMIQARYAHERLAAGTYGKDEAVCVPWATTLTRSDAASRVTVSAPVTCVHRSGWTRRCS